MNRSDNKTSPSHPRSSSPLLQLINWPLLASLMLMSGGPFGVDCLTSTRKRTLNLHTSSSSSSSSQKRSGRSSGGIIISGSHNNNKWKVYSLPNSSTIDTTFNNSNSKKKLRHYRNRHNRRRSPRQQQISTSFASQISSVAQTRSVCDFEANCWTRSQNCAIHGRFPYDRRTPITCGECVRLCQDRRSEPDPYQCKAAVYDFSVSSCDLFAVPITSNHQYAYQGRDVFLPKPTCTTTTSPPLISTPEAPPTTFGPPTEASSDFPVETTLDTTTVPFEETTEAPGDCPPEQVVRYLKTPDSELSNLDGVRSQGVTQDECTESCTSNVNPTTGDPQLCQSFNFIGFGEGLCVISDQSLQDLLDQFTGDEALILQNTPNAAFYEKACFDISAVSDCRGPFIRMPQKVLVGQARAIVDAQNLDDCLYECFLTQEFVCKSGMFYFQEETQNCILNEVDSDDRPGLLVDEECQSDDPAECDAVDYFELNCQGSNLLLSNNKNTLKRDDPAEARISFRNDEKKKVARTKTWTFWSQCRPEGDTSSENTGGKGNKRKRRRMFRKRFEVCDDQRDVRKCPSQHEMCRNRNGGGFVINDRRNRRRKNRRRSAVAKKPSPRPSRIAKKRRSKKKPARVVRSRKRGPNKATPPCLAFIDPKTGRQNCKFGIQAYVINGKKQPVVCHKPIDCNQ